MNIFKITVLALVACFTISGCGKTSVNQSLTPHSGMLTVNESGPLERDSSLVINDSYTPFQECKKEHAPDLVAHHKYGRIYADAYCACKIYGGFDEHCPLNPRFRMYGGITAMNIPLSSGISVAGLANPATPTKAAASGQTDADAPASKEAVKYLMTVFEDHDRRLAKVEDTSSAAAALAMETAKQADTPPKPSPKTKAETPAPASPEQTTPAAIKPSSFAQDLQQNPTKTVFFE